MIWKVFWHLTRNNKQQTDNVYLSLIETFQIHMMLTNWLWLMMVLFTYLHEVLQAKFSHDGFFTNKTSCPFLTSRRFVRVPWPTNHHLTWSTNATNINNVWSFFSSLHNLHLFQALHARQGHLWTLMPKVKLPIKQKNVWFWAEIAVSWVSYFLIWLSFYLLSPSFYGTNSDSGLDCPCL